MRITSTDLTADYGLAQTLVAKIRAIRGVADVYIPQDIVMYKEGQVQSIDDLRAIPLHGKWITNSTRLDMVATIKQFNAPNELDHTQIRRNMDIYVRPEQEDLGRIAASIHKILDTTPAPHGIDATSWEV